MKRPSFQFYPGDWQSNSNLRRCTHEERGIWIDVLCLLHDQEEYGVCRWPLKEIAQSVGAPLAKLKALVAKGVLKGSDSTLTEAFVFVPTGAGRTKGKPVTLIAAQEGPLWYSSRMVLDEYKRVIRANGSHANEAPNPPPDLAPNHAPKGGIGAAPNPPPDLAPSRAGARAGASSSSSSINPHSVEPPHSGSTVGASESPGSVAAWASWWQSEHGVPYAANNLHDARKFNPLAQAWVSAGITTAQMTEAIASARATAKGPIAHLPSYVDSVLRNLQAPPQPDRPPSKADRNAAFFAELNAPLNRLEEIDCGPATRAD